jgi:hypothetical protein
MNIALPNQLGNYIKGLLQTGGYSGSEDVVQEAMPEHQAYCQGMEVVMTPELERLLDEGLDFFPTSQGPLA